jgi:hypothetical protein
LKLYSHLLKKEGEKLEREEIGMILRVFKEEVG